MARRVAAGSDGAVIYLYGVTKTAKAPPRGTKGIDDVAPLEALACGDLFCWVSRVSLLEFAENLSKNMENLDWLAAMSARHQGAVSAIARSGDILPARLGVVFLNELSLFADVQKRKTALQADFRRIEGSEEWGIKVFSAPVAAPMPSVKAKSMSGRDYLKSKSALLPRREAVEPGPEIARFAEAIEKLSRDTAEGGKISGGRRDMLFQASLLVKRANRKKLEAILKRFAKQWKQTRRIEATGPWPPYSFVSRNSQ